MYKNELFVKIIDELASDIMLEVSQEEKESIIETEKSIMEKFAKVISIDTEGVKPSFYAYDDVHTFLKDDENIKTITQNEVLQNAPTKDGDFVTIVKVVK
ncbi:Asp-tRNA(Asn)/Glu-tRNA(Gln) amidotransferase subunit GatC [Mesoplasma photuris]|uniref:Asp-tRNA(Asn)/Glu-tRNA(Gln) amidotransferase subunit GatC n=1 Tax=Mesoplasma photuris TaxID=217731 RepID=UPI00068EE900|nr:Asp-tRNA(Asn)/Glu-tRNA(Gln) amidotransferase subunit GatC [Mesoplasma photuris]